MPLEWEEGNAAQEPDESYNPFAPIDYAARLKASPRHESRSPSQLPPRPGQLYGTDRWMSPPKPLVPPVEADPWDGRFESNFSPERPLGSPPPAPAPAVQLPPYLKRPALSHGVPQQPLAGQTAVWEAPARSSLRKEPMSEAFLRQPPAWNGPAAKAQPSAWDVSAAEAQPSVWDAPAAEEQPSAWNGHAAETQPSAWNAPAAETQPPAWDAPAAETEKNAASDRTAPSTPSVGEDKPARRRRRSERSETLPEKNDIPIAAQDQAPEPSTDAQEPSGTMDADAFRFDSETEKHEETPEAAPVIFPTIGEPGSPYPAFFPTDVRPVGGVETPVQPFDEIAAFFSADGEEGDTDAETAKAFEEAIEEIELPPIPQRPEPIWRDPFEPAAPKKEEPARSSSAFSAVPQNQPAPGGEAGVRIPREAPVTAKQEKAASQKRGVQKAAGQPERPPIRVWRVAALISAAAMLVFCMIVGGRILLKLSANEREMKAVKEEWQSLIGADPRSDASRVELLPAGQTYEPLASPTPTAVIQTPTPTPVIPMNEAAIQSLNKRDNSNVQETPEPTATPVLRTKLTEYPGNPLRNEMESLRELRQESSEVVGRLVIEGVLDEVVVQRNNTYYLTHNYRGSSSEAGAVFVDESCSLRYPPENLLLRGQGSVAGKSFEPLWSYQTQGQAFASAHSSASLTTLYEEAEYVLLAVIVADSDPASAGYFNYASHPTFPTDEEMLSYVESARAHSLYQFSVDVQASDRLLTLATVDTSGSSLVLVFRMARTDGQ